MHVAACALPSGDDAACIDTSRRQGTDGFPGVESCVKSTGVVTSYFVKTSNACSNPESSACRAAQVCRAASSSDPCDAPERCSDPSTPRCFSSKVGGNDVRFRMTVAGRPTVSSQPIYPAWESGGTSTNIVSSFDYSVASTSAYRVTNPTSLSGVVARCNAQVVNFRAKFYWTVSDTVRCDCAYAPTHLHTLIHVRIHVSGIVGAVERGLRHYAVGDHVDFWRKHQSRHHEQRPRQQSHPLVLERCPRPHCAPAPEVCQRLRPHLRACP
jgi:hypothetical protein